MFTDGAVRAEAEREQQRLPVSYFEGALPVPSGWDERPAAYLAFGDTYALERDDARRRGWSAKILAGRHLHLLADPESVASEVVAMLERLGLGA